MKTLRLRQFTSCAILPIMSMAKSTRTRILLALAVLMLAAGLLFNSGLVNINNAVSLYVALPVGTVFLGLFLISRLLQNETELHGPEMHHARDRAERGESPDAAHQNRQVGP